PVNSPPPPERCLLVAERGEQRVRETHAGVVEVDHSLPKGGIERSEDSLPIAMRGHDQFNGRPGQSRGVEQYRACLPLQPRQSGPQELAQALRHAQRAPRSRARAQARQLPTKLQRIERVPGSCLLEPNQLRPRKLNPQPIAEQMMKRPDAQRAERNPRQLPLRNQTTKLKRRPNLSRLPQRRQKADSLLAHTTQRHLQRP